MSKQQTIATAASAVELYRQYREAVTAFPYDPIAAGESFSAWREAMDALSGAARARAGRAVARETAVDEVTRAAAALPLYGPDAVRLLTQARILLEEGVPLEGVLAGMASARPQDEAVVIRGTQAGRPLEARRLPNGAYAVRTEDADGRVSIARVGTLDEAWALLGLRDAADETNDAT